MNVLVLGSNGMAGQTIVKYLRLQGHIVTTAAKTNADLEINIESDDALRYLHRRILGFDYVVNCIGLLVNDSSAHFDRAVLINSWFPHRIESMLCGTNTKLIHLSTDCVFNGAEGPYVETALHSETNAYGRSKSLGEVINSKDITLRMSIIGPDRKVSGTGLLNWLLTTNEITITGWTNAMWNGITTLQLAKCIHRCFSLPNLSGIVHLTTANNQISKFTLLEKINNIYKLNKTIVRGLGPKSVNKILINTTHTDIFEIPNYEIMLNEQYNF